MLKKFDGLRDPEVSLNCESMLKKNKLSSRVVMLVNNPCINDSRVIKSAETLAQAGKEVTVICRYRDGLPIEEYREGVNYIRIKPVPHDWKHLLSRIRFNYIQNEYVGQKLSGWTKVKHLIIRLFFLPVWFAYKQEKRVINKVHSLFRSIALTIKSMITLAMSVAKSLSMFCKLLHKTIKKNIRTVHIHLIKTKKATAQLARIFKRSLKVSLKKIIVSIYRSIEMDEFSSSAKPYLLQLSPTIIHAHDLATLPLAGRAAKYTGSKLIYDSHELEMHRNATYSSLAKFRRKRLESKYIRQSDSVITVSDSIAEHLRQEYAIRLPEVILNTPKFEDFSTPSKTLRHKLKLKKEQTLIVYVGGVTINRGLEQMILALAYMENMHFATVGPRRYSTERELIELAKKANVLHRVHLVDAVLPQDVVGFIKDADVSVLPIQNVCLSYYYCMPNKLLESVFANLPVVVADLREMRRFVEKFKCGVVVDETDPMSIAKGVKEVVTNRYKYTITSEDREYISKHYGWDAQAQRLNQLYERLENGS